MSLVKASTSQTLIQYAKMALPTGLSIIASVVRSQFTARVAPWILDEDLVHSLTPQLDQILNAVKDLKLKDHKVAGDQFEDALRSFKFKLECASTMSEADLRRDSDRIVTALSQTQNSALAALHSQCKAQEQLVDYKWILATEMLTVLNEASAKHIFQESDSRWIQRRMKESKQKCFDYLKRANEMSEIVDFIATKIPVEGYPSKWMVSNKMDLAYELININLQVVNFFYFMEKNFRGDDARNQEVARKEKGEENEEEKGGEKNEIVGECLGAIGGSFDISPLTSAPLLMGLKPIEVLKRLELVVNKSADTPEFSRTLEFFGFELSRVVFTEKFQPFLDHMRAVGVSMTWLSFTLRQQRCSSFLEKVQTNIKFNNLFKILERFQTHAEAMGVAVEWYNQFWLEKFTQSPELIDTIIQKDDLTLFFHQLDVMNVDKQAVLESLKSAFLEKDPRSLSLAESANLAILLDNMRNDDGVHWLEKWGLKDVADVTNGGRVYGSLSDDSSHGPESVFQRGSSLHPKYWNPIIQTSNKYYIRRELTAAAVPLSVALRGVPKRFRILGLKYALGGGTEPERMEGKRPSVSQKASTSPGYANIFACGCALAAFICGFPGFYFESFYSNFIGTIIYFLFLVFSAEGYSAAVWAIAVLLGISCLSVYQSYGITCLAALLFSWFCIRLSHQEVDGDFSQIVFDREENEKKLREMEEEEEEEEKGENDGDWMTLLDVHWVIEVNNHKWYYWFIQTRDEVNVFKIVVDNSEPNLIVQDIRIYSKE